MEIFNNGISYTEDQSLQVFNNGISFDSEVDDEAIVAITHINLERKYTRFVGQGIKRGVLS